MNIDRANGPDACTYVVDTLTVGDRDVLCASLARAVQEHMRP